VGGILNTFLEVSSFGKVFIFQNIYLFMEKKVKRVVRRQRSDNSGLFIPAGLLIGLGVGGIYGQFALGALIGLGVGFLFMAIFMLFR
jgi:hypothetical protein